MVLLSNTIECNDPACQFAGSDAASKPNPSDSKCLLMEKCVSSCAAYGRVCPCAARAAGQAACRAADKLYADDSELFQTKAKDLKHFDNKDLIIQKKLGEGGFSVVHKVTLRTDTSQHYAIKYLTRRIMVDQHTFELGAADLAVEANFLANLSHPNIVTIHGITAGSVETNVAKGRECGFFILIDLLHDTLEKKIEVWKSQLEPGNLLSRRSSDFKERRRAGLVERLKIASEVADAMIYLHSLNIVYRDLKPDNIGFDKNGRAKLFDFGLAKELRTKHLNGTYKLTGNTGSRRYMAPEVAKEQQYDQSVDVFSFGIMLHELTSLEKPFQGYSANKHMLQVVMGGERPRLDTASTSWFPMELQWLLKKCWSKDPLERPTFEAAQKCLQDIIGGHASPSPVGKLGRRLKSTNVKGGPKYPGSPPLMKRSNKASGIDGEAVPDFRKMKPASRPSRQTKSLGFLSRNKAPPVYEA